MENTTFKALRITETTDHTFQRQLIDRNINDLPLGDILIRVAYSSLNYKDALSATGHKGITRHYPHTPGVDASGIVVQSQHHAFQTGDKVLVTGYDLGMNTDGGFAEYIRVPADWVINLPSGLTTRTSMIYGTAGFTAALSLFKLQHSGLTPEQGEVLVTGATGGVGCIAVALLAKLGYHVVASTGKSTAHDFLHQLGATDIISREETLIGQERALLKERWAGVIDNVGGDILTNALKATRFGGHVSCCGLVASSHLNMDIYPFILRGINLLGVASADCPMSLRLQIWNLLAQQWSLPMLEDLVTECDLNNLNQYIDQILQGQIQGRVLVKVTGE